MQRPAIAPSKPILAALASIAFGLAGAAAGDGAPARGGEDASATPPAAGRIAEYAAARSIVWGWVYRGGGETLYCRQRFGADKGRGINVEHVFPMSWVTRHVGCGRRAECRDASAEFNRIEADLHNLWPARADVNEARSSYPFGTLDGEARPFPGCDFELDERRRVAEPRPGARGEIARTMFYMAEEYGLVLYRRLGRDLARWNRDDPVDAAERRRNDRIEAIQGNRNPYVDNPERAARFRF